VTRMLAQTRTQSQLRITREIVSGYDLKRVPNSPSVKWAGTQNVAGKVNGISISHGEENTVLILMAESGMFVWPLRNW
jgi:hypothetical protein